MQKWYIQAPRKHIDTNICPAIYYFFFFQENIFTRVFVGKYFAEISHSHVCVEEQQQHQLPMCVCVWTKIFLRSFSSKKFLRFAEKKSFFLPLQYIIMWVSV